MHKNIFAFTAAGADGPEFISVNEDAEGKISVCVRSPKDLGGHTVQCALDRDTARELGLALITATDPK